MSRFLIVLSILTSFAAGAWAAGQVGVRPLLSPQVFSGSDIGFRMTGRSGDTPVGELVVKVNGEWKAVQFSYAVRPLTQ